MTCRALRWRKRLFGTEWRSKECEEASRRYRFSDKMWRSVESSKQKIINIVGKESELLKHFRDEDESFDRAGLSRSNIFFKISLCKFLKKIPSLTNSSLSSSYVKNNFKLIKKACKMDVKIFSEKKWKYSFHYFLYFLSLFGLV